MVSSGSHGGGSLPVAVQILWRPGGKAIHIAVIHAKGGGNEYGILNFHVRCALFARLLNIVTLHVLAALLHFAGDGEQRLELV